MPGLLQNHIAAITGAGSGIGRAIALGYAREGAQVVVLDINGEAAAETAKQIKAEGFKAQAFTLDVTKREDCFALAKKVAATSAPSRSWSTMPASRGATPSPPIPTPSPRTGRTSWASTSTACSM